MSKALLGSSKREEMLGGEEEISSTVDRTDGRISLLWRVGREDE